MKLLVARVLRLAAIALVAIPLLTGCKTGLYKDPNDPADAGVLAPEVLRQNLKGISDMLNEREAKGEISPAQYRQLIEQGAQELLAKVNIDKVAPSLAWQYVEVLRTAERWDDVVRFAKVAVKDAQRTKNPDRLVNDTLHLAQGLAMTKHPDEAIKTARTVFNAGPTDSGPILPATLYELAPALRGQGRDVEAAKLLEDAIARHMQTVVDPNESHGKDFLRARPIHIRRAWRLIIDLYQSSGHRDLAEQAAKRAEKMMAGFGSA